MGATQLCLRAGMCAGLATGAAGQDRPALQSLDHGIGVEPVRVARAASEGGRLVRVGEWMAYPATRSSCMKETRVFDCFGDDDGDCVPDGGLACGLGSDTSRWFFGTGYCNMFVTADHEVWSWTDIDAGFTRLDLAWYWSCATDVGACIVGVFTQESSPADECEPNSFDYSGWLLDFGSLSCNPGSYYYAHVDLGIESWTIPSGGTGSHLLAFGQDVTTDGALVLASCAQPMLWGTSENNRGTQETEQLDDLDFDLTHTSDECYTYSFGFCPDPLGAMVQFWGRISDPSCDHADFNNDRLIDTRDVLAFLQAWSAGDANAECDCNVGLDTRDVNCFIGIWAFCH